MFLFGKKKKVEAEVIVSADKDTLLAREEEIDKAIIYYETSLQESKVLGKAYTELIKLYNIKRRAAAENKDEAEVKEYMDKIDGLMRLSKDVIRGKV